MSNVEISDALGISRSAAARAVVDRVLAEHFNGSAQLLLVKTFMLADEAGRLALFAALAESATDHPDLIAKSAAADGSHLDPRTSDPGNARLNHFLAAQMALFAKPVTKVSSEGQANRSGPWWPPKDLRSRLDSVLLRAAGGRS